MISEQRRKICVVTGTRAEYGLLYWLMKGIQADDELVLQIVVTGMHLSPEFGLTYKVIESDGFVIDDKVEMLLSSDTTIGITKSIGLGVIGFADTFEWLKPDVLILLGDRFEILAAAQAALIARIPVAHIAGGDVTEGAFDESIRHSITKMSHLHFVTNAQSAARVRQLGEDPSHVYIVGNPGLDHLKRMVFLSREQLAQNLDFSFREHNLLITFHPSSLDSENASRQFQELLRALDRLGENFGLLFTYPNADPQGRELIVMIDEYVLGRQNAKAFASLGQQRYLSLMDQVDAVVGNSSSGLYETPSFKVATINIGDRQKGRLRAASILDCEAKCESILDTVYKAMKMDCSQVVNPYGDGNSSEQILAALKSCKNYQSLLQKKFFEVGYTI
ncbi:MAG: UDP-N-acetylglucosamine 2-epimerase [Negativicutes bacterium]